MSRTLVISCHTDDIELSAGGMISSLSGEVYGYVPTFTHFPETQNECINAWKILGIQMLTGYELSHHAREINRQVLLDDLVRMRKEIKPDLVITHGKMDTHQSHNVVYNESVRAFKDCSILGYSHDWNCQNGSNNTYFFPLTQKDVDNKLRALECYRTQKHRVYFDRSYQEGLMKLNGVRINKQYAEGFEVIRLIQ